MKKLSHINDAGQVQMVDVTDKAPTVRKAKARGQVSMKRATLKLLAEGEKGCELVDALKLLHKGDIPLVVEVARVLSRHKDAAKGKRSGDLWEVALMAAEEGVSYGKK